LVFLLSVPKIFNKRGSQFESSSPFSEIVLYSFPALTCLCFSSYVPDGGRASPSVLECNLEALDAILEPTIICMLVPQTFYNSALLIDMSSGPT